MGRRARARILLAVTAVTLGALIPATAFAQDHTTDSPRLSIGFSAGRHSGTLLWDIGDQPISTGKVGSDGKPTPPSVFDLHREVDLGMTFSGQVNVYFNDHIGFIGELTYLGLGLKDKCTLTTDGGDDHDLRAAVQGGRHQGNRRPQRRSVIVELGIPDPGRAEVIHPVQASRA